MIAILITIYVGDSGEDFKDSGDDDFDADGHSADSRRIPVLRDGCGASHDAPEFILKAQKAIGLAVALAAGIMIVTSLRRPIEAVMHVIKRKQLTNKCS